MYPTIYPLKEIYTMKTGAIRLLALNVQVSILFSIRNIEVLIQMGRLELSPPNVHGLICVPGV